MSNFTLPTYYQEFIGLSRYSRWIEEENRREHWPEPVKRYVDSFAIPVMERSGLSPDEVKDLSKEIFDSIASLEVMPSMRTLMTAGPALWRDEMAGYNCSFVAMDHPRAFDEILYILTCGTGVGFSCESRFVNKLPEVAEELHDTDTTIVVSDSRIGWASSFRELISLLYAGKVPTIDVSKVRAKGERLKTFGGRASGPGPLVDLFNYCIRIFRGAVGRKLTDIEVHGIVCKIGEIVVVGGVRRSALISLSDLHSARMRSAKSFYEVKWHTINPEGEGNVSFINANGDQVETWATNVTDHERKLLSQKKLGWWRAYPEFALANNSAAYNEKPTVGEFFKEWSSLYESKSGERGIYNREGIRNKIDSDGRRDSSAVVGTNPCGEIALRSGGLCNLSEIVVRPSDGLGELSRKARIASILGTLQSTLTNFRYVRPLWRRNAEEERLLGVSLTGIFDHPVLNGTNGHEILEEWLAALKQVVRETNEEFSAKLGIPPSLATTCVKPSGTVSQLVNSASGIHPRHSQFYLRSVRGDNKDPLTAFMKAAGIPHEPEVCKPDQTTIFYFPIKAPEGSIFRDEIEPRYHLELWEVYNRVWAEHQVSITVSVPENKWIDTAAWVYDNFDSLSGVSFLPEDLGTYRQAPYQTLTESEYNDWVSRLPDSIDWNLLALFESEDATTGSRELACVAGACEI